MKSLRMLWQALPLSGKLIWCVMGGLPLLLGLLGRVYTLYWQLTPEAMHWPAFPPDVPGFTANIASGLAVTVAFAGFGYLSLRKRRAQQRLVQLGQRLDLPVARVEESTWRGSNGTRYYYLYSYWQNPATGRRHTFESERLDFDASPYLRQGDTLPVYLMPNDPEHYYFDVSSLPRPKRFFWE